MKHWAHFLPEVGDGLEFLANDLLKKQADRNALQKQIDKLDKEIEESEQQLFDIASGPDMWNTHEIAEAKSKALLHNSNQQL